MLIGIKYYVRLKRGDNPGTFIGDPQDVINVPVDIQQGERARVEDLYNYFTFKLR